MRKIKKILTAIATTTISAVSLCSMFSVSAETTQLNTFRIYHNVAANSNISFFDFTIYYSSIITANPSKKTALLNNGYFSSFNNGKVVSRYNGNPIKSSGTIATTEFYAPISTKKIFDEISYSATISDNNGNNKDPNSITMNAVLLGDVNQDGIVNNNDVADLNMYLLDPDNYPLTGNKLLAADVMGDGIIDASDSLLIMNYVNGSIDRF